MLLFQTSREIIFYFQHFIQVCFYFLGKKLGGTAPPPRPLPLLRHCNGYAKFWGVNKVNFESKDQQSLKWGGSAKRFNPSPFKTISNLPY